MKTAISVPDDIFREVDEFAKKQSCSRSEVFTLAVKEFLEKSKSRQLLNTLNEVYSEPEIETAEDRKRRRKAISHFARKVLKNSF